MDSRQSGDGTLYDRLRCDNGAFGSTSYEIRASAACPLLSYGGDVPAFGMWFLVGSGRGWHIHASANRILHFGSDRMLARVSPLAGGVSSGAGARSRNALVNALIEPLFCALLLYATVHRLSGQCSQSLAGVKNS